MDIRIAKLFNIRGGNPECSFGRVVVQAPQLEAFVRRWMQRLRPVLNDLYGARRRLATAGLAALTAWLFLHVMLGANGMVVYRQKRAEYEDLQKQVKGLQKENDRYSDQIKALTNDPKTIEKEAREQLHYARPGEIVYVSPLPLPPQSSATSAASNPDRPSPLR
jgi:cell division protein FtsB